MSLRDREGLVARVKQMRRTPVAGETPTPAPNPSEPSASALPASPEVGQRQSLETRVAHLERLLEGLQDSVHRESHRQDRRISDLEARLEPSALAVELSRNARERGL